MNRRLRVAVVGVAWPVETFVERLLTGLATAGVELTIVSSARPDPAWLRRHGIAWEVGPRPVGARHAVRLVPRNGVRATASAFRLAAPGGKKRDPITPDRFDVVYAPWINTLTADTHLLDTGVPIVTSCRGSLVTIAPWDPRRRAHTDALPEVFSAARLVHCVSDDIAADAAALGLSRSKVRVIRPAVDPVVFAPSGDTADGRTPLRVVSVGNLLWSKDHEHALMACRNAVDRGVDLHLDVIGDGSARQQIRFTIDDLDLGDQVTLHGLQPPGAVAQILREGDVFLHMSSSEGISNAVLEAMATGLAVVSTDAGGMREAIRHERDGLLVPVRDSTGAADALVALAGDRSLRQRMGASARERIEDRFRLEDQITSFHELLHEAAFR